MAERFSLSIVLKAVDQLSAPMKKIVPVVKQLGVDAAALSVPLRAVNAAFSGVKRGLVAMRPALLAVVHPIRALRWEYARLGLTMKDVGKKLKDLGRDIGRVGRELTTKLTLPIAAMATGSVWAAAKFETAFLEVKETVKGTTEELETLKVGLRDLATKMPVNVEALAAIAKAGGQIGITAKNILPFTKTMAEIGIATEWVGEEAVTAMTKYMNATELPIASLENLGSALTVMKDEFKAAPADVMDMSMRLAGLGKVVGLTEAQIVGMSAALISVGVEGGPGGMALRQMIIKINDAMRGGSKEAIKHAGYMARIAKVPLPQYKKMWKEDTVGALMKFIDGLGRLTKEGKNTLGVLDAIGLDGPRIIETLTKAAGSSEKVKAGVKDANDAWGENNALTKDVEEKQKLLENRWETFKNKLKDLAITIGDILTPTVKDLLAKLGEWADWFGKLDPATQKLTLVIAGIAAAIGPLAIGIGGLISILANLILIGVFFQTAWWPIILTVGLVALAIVGLGIAAYQIYKHWEPITAFFRDTWKSIKATFYDGLIYVLELMDKFIPKGVLKFLGIDLSGIEDSIAKLQYLSSELRSPALPATYSTPGFKWTSAKAGWSAGTIDRSRADVNIKVSSEKGTSAVLDAVTSIGATKVNVFNQAYVGGR